MTVVSRTTPVGLRGQNIWVYCGSLALLLVEVVRAIEELPRQRRPPWWAQVAEAFRLEAQITDMFLDLDLGLTEQQRDELAQVFAQTADRLGSRLYFTPEEVAGWDKVPELPPSIRGEQLETGPTAELARALADLIRGTLPPAPPGTWWFYTGSGERRTIAMREPWE